MLTPDQIEEREQIRNTSRLLRMLGGTMFAFAAIAAIYAGIDMRTGTRFMFNLMVGSGAIGVVLTVWGYIVRSRVASIHDTTPTVFPERRREDESTERMPRAA